MSLKHQFDKERLKIYTNESKSGKEISLSAFKDLYYVLDYTDRNLPNMLSKQEIINATNCLGFNPIEKKVENLILYDKFTDNEIYVTDILNRYGDVYDFLEGNDLYNDIYLDYPTDKDHINYKEYTLIYNHLKQYKDQEISWLLTETCNNGEDFDFTICVDPDNIDDLLLDSIVTHFVNNHIDFSIECSIMYF